MGETAFERENLLQCCRDLLAGLTAS